MKSVLVTGATGFVGQHLVNRLLQDDVRVRIFTRGARPLPNDWTGRIEVAKGDLTDEPAIVHAAVDCEVVFHLAGELHDAKHMWATNTEGTRNLLSACQKADVRQIVHLSSVGVIGASNPGIVDETTPCKPLNGYEQSKYAAEQLALAWSAQTARPLIALRPTIVFGDGLRSGSDSMLSWLRVIQRGQFAFFDQRAVANYVYVGDVAAACRLAGQTAKRGVFIVADSCSLVDFVIVAASILDVPPPRLFIPAPVAYVLALTGQAFAQLIGQKNPLTVARVRVLTSRTQYDSTRIRSVLGWRPEIGWREGLRLTVKWYRQSGQLG